MNDVLYQDELEQQTDVYEKGRILKTIPTNAWDVIKDTVHSYVEDADKQVRTIKPGDPSVIAAQAALYALHAFETFFVQDTEAAMNFAAHPSEEFQRYLFGVRDQMDVLKQQGVN